MIRLSLGRMLFVLREIRCGRCDQNTGHEVHKEPQWARRK